jgi:hypothetical protein
MAHSSISGCLLPEGREREILVILIEEVTEVIQEATKMLRFGVTSFKPGQEYDDIDRLSHEVGDFLVMLGMAELAGLVRPESVSFGRDRKRRQLAKFMRSVGPEPIADPDDSPAKKI